MIPVLGTYSSRVLALYSRLPDTPSRPRRTDRLLVARLHARSVALDLIESALLLASARRRRPSPNLTPLPPVRSLAYYLPVIDELLQHPLPHGYGLYLRSKVLL